MPSILDKIRRIPAEKYVLPSRGIGYSEGVFGPGVVNGEVEVFPMGTYDEILLKTPELLLSGDGVFNVIARKVPDILRPEDLFQKDVEYLLTCLRKVSYGEFIVLPHRHDCEEAKLHDYQISIIQFLKNTKAIDPTQINSYKVVLENDQVVILNNITFRDVLTLTQIAIQTENNDDISPKDAERITVDAVSSLIKSVDEETDRTVIAEWLKEIPISYRHAIQAQIAVISESWGTDFTTTLKCRDCGKDMDVTPSLNPVSFFTRL